MRSIFWIVGLAAICLGPVAADAQEFFPRTPTEVQNVARAFGSIERGDNDSQGRPILLGDVDGTLYSVVLYGCTNDRSCASAQFYASFISDNNTLEFVNTWNQDKRFANAYLASDGDAVLTMSANLDFGVSRQNFIDTFDIWVTLMRQFDERIFSTGAEAGNTPPRK